MGSKIHYYNCRKPDVTLTKKQIYINLQSLTLKKKDKETGEDKVIHKGSALFKTEDIKCQRGYEAKYDELLKQNELLFTLDLVKEKVSQPCKMTDEIKMVEEIGSIMEICQAENNEHFIWFSKLLNNHFDGIIAHATYKISSSKIEGINKKSRH